MGFSSCSSQALGHRLWLATAEQLSPCSVDVACGLSYSKARGIFPDQGSNLCLLHRQEDSLPLSHQGGPPYSLKDIYLAAWGLSCDRHAGSLLWLVFFVDLVLPGGTWDPRLPLGIKPRSPALEGRLVTLDHQEVQGDGFSFLQEGQGDFHWGRERRVRASEDQAGEIPLGRQGEGGQEPRETELLGSVQGQWGVEIGSVPPKEDGYRVFPGRSDGGYLGQGS